MRPRPPPLASVHRLQPARPDDASLARGAAARDPAAQEAIWHRYSKMVRGILRRSLGPADAEDLVQEVFLRYFRSPGDLHDPDKLRGFLYGIAVRVARSELRRRRLRRWLRLTDDGVVPEVDSAPLDADAREAVARLYAILDRTSDEARLLFVLRCIEKLEVAEVAACLELPLGTTKRKLGKVVPHIFAIARRDPLLAEYIRRSGEISEEIQEESDET